MKSKQEKPELPCGTHQGSRGHREKQTHVQPPHSLSPVFTFTPCLSEAHCLPALSPVLHRDLSTDPTWVTCLFTNGEGTYHLLFCVQLLVWRSEYKSKEFWYQLASHTHCFTDRTAIVMITTLSLSPFPTALPEHKQFHRNFQTGTPFAHYRVVLFRYVHSLKTTGSNDFESQWLQGSICEQALYFSSLGLAVHCAGLR